MSDTNLLLKSFNENSFFWSDTILPFLLGCLFWLIAVAVVSTGWRIFIDNALWRYK